MLKHITASHTLIERIYVCLWTHLLKEHINMWLLLRRSNALCRLRRKDAPLRLYMGRIGLRLTLKASVVKSAFRLWNIRVKNDIIGTWISSLRKHNLITCHNSELRRFLGQTSHPTLNHNHLLRFMNAWTTIYGHITRNQSLWDNKVKWETKEEGKRLSKDLLFYLYYAAEGVFNFWGTYSL